MWVAGVGAWNCLVADTGTFDLDAFHEDLHAIHSANLSVVAEHAARDVFDATQVELFVRQQSLRPLSVTFEQRRQR